LLVNGELISRSFSSAHQLAPTRILSFLRRQESTSLNV